MVRAIIRSSFWLSGTGGAGGGGGGCGCCHCCCHSCCCLKASAISWISLSILSSLAAEDSSNSSPLVLTIWLNLHYISYKRYTSTHTLRSTYFQIICNASSSQLTHIIIHNKTFKHIINASKLVLITWMHPRSYLDAYCSFWTSVWVINSCSDTTLSRPEPAPMG